MGYVTPIDLFLNKFKRPGFILYIGLVVGALGWTLWEMRSITKRLEEDITKRKSFFDLI